MPEEIHITQSKFRQCIMWWGATIVAAVLLAIAAYLFSESGISLGGGKPSQGAYANMPGWLLGFTLIWLTIGPFITLVLAVTALLKTFFR